MIAVPPGIYEHYKKKPYEVITLLLPSQSGRAPESEWANIAEASHSETLASYPIFRSSDGYYFAGGAAFTEPHVLYRQRYAEYGFWLRPAKMFAEAVVVDGTARPRFRYLGPPDPTTGDVAAFEVVEKAVTHWQNAGVIHPLTCGNASGHRLLYAVQGMHAPELRCPDCGYVQRWIPPMVVRLYRDMVG